ncbi:MAG: NUDIX domain-containing protein [Candidatus Nanoarchaeia archaeon]
MTEKLPLRKNCEGYFLDGKGNILAKKSDGGQIIFPGGGVNEGETPEKGLLREAHEETGVVIKGKLKKLRTLTILWDKDWITSKKQRNRYKKFKGDKMYFYKGKIDKIEKPKIKDEDYWKGKKLIPIREAINDIENKKPFNKSIKKYREIQLKFIKSFL